MSKIHCVGEHRSDQTTRFGRAARITLRGVAPSLEQLRRYCGTRGVMALRHRAILMAAIALPMAPVGASAQQVPDSRATWAGESGTASYYGNWNQGKRT